MTTDGMSHEVIWAELKRADRNGQPLLMRQLVSLWPAIRLWSKEGAGLERMKQLTDPETMVSVMHSQSDIFVGDLHTYTPMPMRLHEFLGQAQQAEAGAPGPYLYLAQHEISAAGTAGLSQDVPVPECLAHQTLSSRNIWMCIRGSRSNIHYDRYSNVLTVVRGRKRVFLYSPELTPCLYPAPVGGDNNNHSLVNFAAPDFKQHPLFATAIAAAKEFVLEPGDALFIPEGYWHQVDSEGVTVAVNFWWASSLRCMVDAQPQSAFYLARTMIADSLAAMTETLLAGVPPLDLTAYSSTLQPLHTDGSALNRLSTKEHAALTAAAAILQPSCAMTHRQVHTPELPTANSAPPPPTTITNSTTLGLPIDPLSCLLAALRTAEMINVLFSAAIQQPGLITAMFGVSHLTPLTAYLLTRGFEAADAEGLFQSEPEAEQLSEAGDSAQMSAASHPLQAEQGQPSAGSQARTLQAELGQQTDAPTMTMAHASHDGMLPIEGGGHTICSQSQFYTALYGAAGSDPSDVFQMLVCKREQLTNSITQLLFKRVLGIDAA